MEHTVTETAPFSAAAAAPAASPERASALGRLVRKAAVVAGIGAATWLVSAMAHQSSASAETPPPPVRSIVAPVLTTVTHPVTAGHGTATALVRSATTTVHDLTIPNTPPRATDSPVSVGSGPGSSTHPVLVALHRVTHPVSTTVTSTLASVTAVVIGVGSATEPVPVIGHLAGELIDGTTLSPVIRTNGLPTVTTPAPTTRHAGPSQATAAGMSTGPTRAVEAPYHRGSSALSTPTGVISRAQPVAPRPIDPVPTAPSTPVAPSTATASTTAPATDAILSPGGRIGRLTPLVSSGYAQDRTPANTGTKPDVSPG